MKCAKNSVDNKQCTLKKSPKTIFGKIFGVISAQIKYQCIDGIFFLPEQVLKLKQKIEAERGKDYPTESQKLIYAGKYKLPIQYNIDEV